MPQITRRQYNIIRFAVWKFMNQAYSIAGALAQDKKESAGQSIELFMKDAKEAEVILKMLKENNEEITTITVTPTPQCISTESSSDNAEMLARINTTY